jgi:aminoglycoside 3-N-acetyltransferase
MIGYADLRDACRQLSLAGKPLIVHASLRKFGGIQGGPGTILRALRDSFGGFFMPTFTYKTMVTPGVGPPNNGITYGNGKDLNKMAESFHPAMPPDPLMGALPLQLLHEEDVFRTSHPILSFAGVDVEEILLTQTLFDPLAPIGALAERGGWALLINVDHSANTSIHYGEKLAGRRQFVRWAVTGGRIVECPGYPGDSTGFNAIEEYVQFHTRRVEMEGGAFLQALPLTQLLNVTVELIKRNPLALLCQREDCEMCKAVRNAAVY